MDESDFTVIEYPASRQFTMDTGRISNGKHFVRALLEVDVTDALQKIKQVRTREHKVSFQAWLIRVLAEAVAAHPPVNGIRRGRNAVVVFKSVDVSTVVEKRVNGTLVPLPMVLRGANFKSPFELTAEIQAAVDQSVSTAGDLVLGKEDNSWLIRLGLLLPQWARLAYMRWFILGNPPAMQKLMGTVMVTSLSTTGRLSGWIIPTAMHPLSIGIGSLNKKAAFVGDAVQKRDILHLTVTIDHDVIDGMPAMRFVDDFVTRLERGDGLEPAH
jgi:pyruvate/2-oxoglutarate dehydrogenase complex dihydrolipoamide acyltransferase (E2) component